MRLTQPGAPFQGLPAENVFFAADDRYVQLGLGYVVPFVQADLFPERPLQVYLHIEAQPSARNILLGALLAKAEQFLAMYPHMKGRIYAQLDPSEGELLHFYARGGLAVTDSEDEYVFPLSSLAPRTPMGCEFASVPLLTQQDQRAFLSRLIASRLTPIASDYLLMQMQQPFFMALGYYRGAQPLAELLFTGSTPENIALVALYVRAEYRRRGTGRSLVDAAGAILTGQGVSRAAVRAYSRSDAQTGLVRSLGGIKRRTVSVLPCMEIGPA